jgi:hypothetical protein
MPETELLASIDSYSDNEDGGELSRQRAIALQRYAGINLEPAPPGRSQVVDRTAFETVQWIMPSMMRIFAGDDNIVEFEPFDEDDSDVAEQESDYLNYLVTQRNNWDLTVRTWTQDALTTKNAYCWVFMEEKIVPEIDSYKGQSEEQLALLVEDDVDVIEAEERENEDAEPQLVDPATGELIDPEDQETMLGAMAIYATSGQEPVLRGPPIFDVKLRRNKPVKRLRYRVLPPERCKVGDDTPDFTLEDCKFFEYWEVAKISDIRKMGYDIDDDIGDEGSADTEEDAARDEFLEIDRDTDNPDPSMREVILRRIWIEHDYDEDGIAELQYVVLVGREVLEREEVTTIPVSSIVPFINTHRHMGNSVIDLVDDIQQIKTKIQRNGLDSLEYSLRPERVVSQQVHMSDFLESKPGGIKRLKKGAIPGEGHVQELVVPFVFPQAQEGLRHMDTVTESRIGVNRMFQGIDESNINDHNRIGQLSTMAAQRIEDMARLFGVGFKRLFAISHELLIKSGHSQEVIKLRGEFVTIDPSQWRTGRDMRVTAPYAAGNKDSLLQRLMLLKQIHTEAAMAGHPMVQLDDSYELALEIAKAADVAGTKFFTDPKTIEPPPEQPDPTMMAVEIEAQKVSNEAEDEARSAELDKYKADLDAETRTVLAKLNSETQIALAQLKEGQQINVETVKAQLKDAPVQLGEAFEVTNEINNQVAESIRQITEALSEMKAVAESPIKIVRENGRIVGKEVNGRFIPLEDAG